MNATSACIPKSYNYPKIYHSLTRAVAKSRGLGISWPASISTNPNYFEMKLPSFSISRLLIAYTRQLGIFLTALPTTVSRKK